MLERWRRETGQVLLEYALVAPVFFLIILGIMELGRVVFTYSTIANAAREGARYGVVHPEDTVGIRDAALVHTIGLDQTRLQIVSSQNGITVNVGIDYQIGLVSGNVIGAMGGDSVVDLHAQATMRVE